MAWSSDPGPGKVLNLYECLNYWAIEHVSSQEFQDVRTASFFTIKGLFAKSLWSLLFVMCVCMFVCFVWFCPSECVSECYIVQPVTLSWSVYPYLFQGVQALGYLCSWSCLSAGGTRTDPELIRLALSGDLEGMVLAVRAVSSRVAFLWSKIYLLNAFLWAEGWVAQNELRT